MKKIMFNDRYGLTKAVLKGRKTMTRRIVNEKMLACANDYVQKVHGTGHDFLDYLLEHSLFKVGEVAAVAQSYKDAGLDEKKCDKFQLVVYGDFPPRRNHGWTNKMFVRADLMPHQIRITNVRVERLQDISDEDCIREGIEEDSPYYWVPVNKSLPNWRKTEEGVSDMYPNDRDGKVYPHFWDSPRKAFAALIDKIFGKGTWESNPWVFVSEFNLL